MRDPRESTTIDRRIYIPMTNGGGGRRRDGGAGNGGDWKTNERTCFGVRYNVIGKQTLVLEHVPDQSGKKHHIGTGAFSVTTNK